MKYLPEWKQLGHLIMIILFLASVFALSPATTLAEVPGLPSTVGKYDATLTPQGIRSQFGLDEHVEVVNDSQLSELIALCHRIGAYLVRQEDGTLALRLDNPGAVGVSRGFLNDYQAGLNQINNLIRRGWVTVDENLDLQRGPRLPNRQAAIDAGLAEIEGRADAEGADAVLPTGEGLEHHGRDFSFSFHSRRHHLPYHYASLGPTFAAYFDAPEYGARFGLVFALNQRFFERSFYYGGYFFAPWHNPRHVGHKHRFYYWPAYYGYFTGRWQTVYLYS